MGATNFLRNGRQDQRSVPDFVPKTDEIRVQLLADALERHCGKEFIVTEKLDGSSSPHSITSPSSAFAAAISGLMKRIHRRSMWQSPGPFN